MRNGGDSDDDDDNARDFDETMREVKLEKLRVLLVDDRIEKAGEGGMNFMWLHVGESMDQDEVKTLKAPENWVGPPPNKSKGGSTFYKLTTQVNGVHSATTLHLCLNHTEANTRLIVSHMNARQFCQIKTTL